MIHTLFIINKSGGLIYKYMKNIEQNTNTKNENNSTNIDNLIKTPKTKALHINPLLSHTTNTHLIISSILHTQQSFISTLFPKYNTTTICMTNDHYATIYVTLTNYTFVFFGNEEAPPEMFDKVYGGFCNEVIGCAGWMEESVVARGMFDANAYF